MVCPYIDATQSGVVMSAFALNKPVVATKVGALPTMVKNGQYGTIVPPKDVATLASAINTLIENPQKIEAMIHMKNSTRPHRLLLTSTKNRGNDGKY